jgi:hypothetical protein
MAISTARLQGEIKTTQGERDYSDIADAIKKVTVEGGYWEFYKLDIGEEFFVITTAAHRPLEGWIIRGIVTKDELLRLKNLEPKKSEVRERLDE